MKYERFEDLPVWQSGINLCCRVFTTTEDGSFRYRGDIANQLQRAALSVPNNIAEGFERGTTAELIRFLYYARGSAGEVRSIFCVIERLRAFGHLRPRVEDLKSQAEGISRQLWAWIQSLQNTDIQGQRHLNDETRRSYEQKRRAEPFMENVRLANEKQHRKRMEARRSQISDLKSQTENPTSEV